MSQRSFEERVAIEHRLLEAIFAEVSAALDDGEPLPAVRDAFARLREALEAHVDQEDRLYYPAVRALRPVHRNVIGGLVGAHELFRSQLGEIDDALARGAIAEAGRALTAFIEAFGEHEAAEERLLRAIDAELSEAVHAKPV